MMKIQINGEKREVKLPQTLLGLLEDLRIGTAGIAVELNREVIVKERWASTTIREGDALEIVRFVGGG